MSNEKSDDVIELTKLDVSKNTILCLNIDSNVSKEEVDELINYLTKYFEELGFDMPILVLSKDIVATTIDKKDLPDFLNDENPTKSDLSNDNDLSNIF